MRRTPPVVLLRALSAGLLEAQIVRGQVADSITQVPVAGTTAALLDASDTPVASAAELSQ